MPIGLEHGLLHDIYGQAQLLGDLWIRQAVQLRQQENLPHPAPQPVQHLAYRIQCFKHQQAGFRGWCVFRFEDRQGLFVRTLQGLSTKILAA